MKITEEELKAGVEKCFRSKGTIDATVHIWHDGTIQVKTRYGVGNAEINKVQELFNIRFERLYGGNSPGNINLIFKFVYN